MEVRLESSAGPQVVSPSQSINHFAEQWGTQMLAFRQRELLAWRAGELPVGNEFAGRRVVVQIDGGRLRVRENRKPKRKRPRRKGQCDKFDTPWREPKVLTIFEIDAQDKLTKKHRQPLIDGTLLGPDHLAELLAYHLHRLGEEDLDRRKRSHAIADDTLARWLQELTGRQVVLMLDTCHSGGMVEAKGLVHFFDENMARVREVSQLNVAVIAGCGPDELVNAPGGPEALSLMPGLITDAMLSFSRPVTLKQAFENYRKGMKAWLEKAGELVR